MTATQRRSMLCAWLMLLLMLCGAEAIAKPAQSCDAKKECELQCQQSLSSPRFQGGKIKDAACLDPEGLGRCCTWSDPRWNICGCVIELRGQCISSTNGQIVDCDTKAERLPVGGCYCSAGKPSKIPLSLGLLLLFGLYLWRSAKTRTHVQR